MEETLDHEVLGDIHTVHVGTLHVQMTDKAAVAKIRAVAADHTHALVLRGFPCRCLITTTGWGV